MHPHLETSFEVWNCVKTFYALNMYDMLAFGYETKYGFKYHVTFPKYCLVHRVSWFKTVLVV